jgi:acetyl esterase
MAPMLPIDPGMLSFYEALSAKTPAGSENWPLAEQRAAWDTLCKDFRSARPPGIDVADTAANGIPVRVFGPKGATRLPAAIYAHGGGWVLGSPETHDDMCAEMASAANCVVVLMDYRLAPEHPYPAQLEDSIKVWRWMLSQPGIDRTRIIGAGDSCGGQMSVALAMTLLEMGLPQLAGLLLIYPVLGANTETASYIRNAGAPCLTKSEMEFYLKCFLGPEGSPSWRDAKAVPNLLLDPSGLPPAFISVAAHDPLHDDGVIFAEKLKHAGIPCELRSEPALAHSYMRARHHSKPAMEGFRWICNSLKALAHGQ